MSYDKAIEEIKKIFRSYGFDILKEKLEKRLDEDLSDWLAKFEEGCNEANEEFIRENLEPSFDIHDLD